MIGVRFGIVAIVWGLVSQKKGSKALALVGAGGIAFTLVLCGGLFSFGMIHRDGVYDELRQKLAEQQLGQLVQSIEFYKVANGDYPTSLQQLQEAVGEKTTIFIHDPTDVKIVTGPRYFYYELVGTDRYYLRSVGPDGQPLTADDIVPTVNNALLPKLGLLFASPART